MPTDTPPPSPADDELVEMMTQSMAVSSTEGYGDYQQLAEAAFNRIRPHLEARGIEMASRRLRDTAVTISTAPLGYHQTESQKQLGRTLVRISDDLFAFSQQHAEGKS